MKKSICFQVLLAALLPCRLSAQQPSWEWVNPYPTGQQINQVYFFDPMEGIVFGDGGTLLGTTDGGTTWHQTDVPRDVFLIKAIFVDRDNGWVLGRSNQYSGSRVLKTSDGGRSWGEQVLPPDYRTPYDFTFQDAQNGLIVGDNGLIFRTTNGGNTWLDKSLTSGVIPLFYSVQLSSATDGLALGRAYSNNQVFVIGRTFDGGDTWRLQFSGLQNEMRSSDRLGNGALITVGAGGLILKSQDEGNNWCFPMGMTSQTLNAVDFYNDLLGITVGEAGTIMISNDGGAVWQEILSGYTTSLKSVYYLNENDVVAGGSQSPGYGVASPNILWSTDGGDTWSNKARYIDQPLNIFAISMVSDARVWVAGNNYIYATSDSGVTWKPLHFSQSDDLRDVVFVDSANGVAVGTRYGQSLVLRTTNAGSTWQPQSFANIYGLYRVSFPIADTGYAVGDGGALLKTTNRGQSWSRLNSGTTNPLFDVEFVSPRIGWVADGNSVLKTTDGGATWSSYQITTSEFIRQLSIVSASVGFAASDYSLYKTTNAGVTWTQLPIYQYGIQDILFVDENQGWAASYQGILITRDGGLSWQTELPTSGYFQFFRFARVPNGRLWVGGSNGAILKYSSDVMVGVTERTTNNLPKDFLLFQNYPNPFNPSTEIGYDLPKSAHVILTIHNILGQEIARLVDQQQEPGRRRVSWHSENVASGVYMYRLQADNFTQTRKMTLMR